MALLTLVLSAFVVFALAQVGLIAFTGGGWLVDSVNLIISYLGHSMLFFIPVFLGYCFFFARLKACLARYEADPENFDQAEDVRFYNGGMELFITLFFAIGVLFTAWGMQNALVSALGNVSKAQAGEMGAWGILKRLVDNGILVALWTTIVGGAGGYLMRLVKYIFVGKALIRYTSRVQDAERKDFFEKLTSIQSSVKRIEEKDPRDLHESLESIRANVKRIEEKMKRDETADDEGGA